MRGQDSSTRDPGDRRRWYGARRTREAHRLTPQRWAALAVLVSVSWFATVGASPAFADYDMDCDDFATSRDAQDYYEENPVDGADLDRDKDGYACDWESMTPGRAATRTTPRIRATLRYPSCP